MSSIEPPWTPDWSLIPESSVDYLLEDARFCLQGTIDLGVNGDQRSASLCGVVGGGAFAMFAVAATILTVTHVNATLIAASIVTGILLLAASLICARAAAPEDFYGPGYEPKRLYISATDTLWMKRYVIEDMQRRIEANRTEINREAMLVKWAIRSASGALILGTLLFFASLF
jgi:hypothetical protein